jgi:hypothetical protein
MHRFVNTPARTKRADPQRGAALLIAIFILMLISVMATALILMAGTESALKGNYKSAMQAFYFAKAGLEEGRGRLSSRDPNQFGTTVFPSTGTAMLPGWVEYITNPSPGETVDPTDPANAYYDSEYKQEWGVEITSASHVDKTPSTSVTVSPLARPLYKWVRITPRTELSGGMDVNGDGTLDGTNPLYYDGKEQLLSSGSGTSIPGAFKAWQVFTVTALAVTSGVLPARRMVQYTVAPLSFTFPAALMLDGTNPTYQGQSYDFKIRGNNDQNPNVEVLLPGCGLPSPQNAVPAIGTLHHFDANNLVYGSSIPSAEKPNYTGTGSLTPDIEKVASNILPSLQSPSQLEGFVATLTHLATEVVPGPASSLPSYGTLANPVVAVVNGDLTLPSNTTGYGILVVRGNFNFDGTSGWRGIVLVIGQGVINAAGLGNNQFAGAIFVAKTRDSLGNQLSFLGSPQVYWSDGSSGTGTSIGNGIYYDSCWINYAWSALPYQVLSFREIPQ